MAVSESMFLFEVVLENVKSLVESKEMTIRAEFADVFSLDLKDPKQLNIVMPQPPPPPPEPPGKGKGKGKGKAKAKPAKGKKGILEPPPPPEPVIQSGQSVLFASSGELLLAAMKKSPMTVSIWSKEDNMRFIGSANITWDHQYLDFLGRICKCEKPEPLIVKGDYNIFDEETAKLIATVTLQMKLSYLEDKITSQFRTVTNLVSGTKKCLYTGIHSKNTSYMCSLKISDPVEGEDAGTVKDVPSPHIESTFVKAKDAKPKEMRFADYKNAPATNTTFFSDDADYCCIGKADKPPISTYTAPKVMPDLNYMADYVSNVIRSCNENLRMLTPQLEIRPKHRATDIDRLCGCNRNYPVGSLANLMKNDPKHHLPCAMCSKPTKSDEQPRSFQLGNIRGPCGKVECKVAHELRGYIESLAVEDNKEVVISDIVGPCGSTLCTVADRIQKFIRQEGVFSSGETAEGLSTVCACEDKLKKSFDLNDPTDSQSLTEYSTENIVSCSSKSCPNEANNTYCVGYCTVVNNVTMSNNEDDDKMIPNNDDTDDSEEDFCETDCTGIKNKDCSKDVCAALTKEIMCTSDDDCSKTCGTLNKKPFISQNDSDIEINLRDIKNACRVKSCDVVEKVKDFLIEGALHARPEKEDEYCYWNCECKFGFGQKTTYCAVCGGYEVEGTDLKEKPPFAMPVSACPIYHKLYDKNKFKLNPAVSDPHNEQKSKKSDEAALKVTKSAKLNEPSSKANTVLGGSTGNPVSIKPEKSIGKDSDGGEKKVTEKKTDKKTNAKEQNIDFKPESDKKGKQEKKTVGKFTFNRGFKGIAPQIGHSRCHLPYNARGARAGITTVPRHMGWLWNAEDVPGLKYRPDWRPGAASKRVVNLLRGHQNPELARKKKRKNEAAKAKPKAKLEKKPLLTIHKKDGQYSVTMETMKVYPKQRVLNQYPYEDKLPETFFVGRTDEENEKRQKRLQRERRRKERAERQFLQQSFRNECQEICMTTYRQAIGILKTDESPECPCFPAIPDVINIDSGHSCSCSDTYSSSGSEADDDEWLVEFTPPVARYDPKFKSPSGPKHHTASQYSYLDYKVKLVGKNGTAVPRFFRGPDGKEVCSDLGGFYGPTGEFLQIGIDGYVSPEDGRWVPNTFVGPDGQIIDSAAGKFQGPDGEWLVIGVDGHIDASGNWVYDPPRPPPYPARTTPWASPSDATWSCFGDNVPAMKLAGRGIVGHSRDRKLLLERLKEIQRSGTVVTFPEPSTVPRSPYRPTNPRKKPNWEYRYRCRHPTPSTKGFSVDSEGIITYFRAVPKREDKAGDRMRILEEQGIDMCDYHIPCFDSSIGCREFKKLKKSSPTMSSTKQSSRYSPAQNKRHGLHFV